MTNLKIINKSSRTINDEIVDAMMFKSLSEANEVLAEYNLKLREIERVFDDDDHVTETILTIDDTKSSDI